MTEPQIQPYKRPPITEAVLELRFRDQLTNDQVEKIARQIKKRYFFDEHEQQHVVKIEPDVVKTSVNNVMNVWKLSSFDRADIVIIRPSALSVSRLAPYKGWDELFVHVKLAWSNVRKVAGKPAISRIGLRIINRVDVPNDGSDWFARVVKVFPAIPENLGASLKNYFVQLNLSLDDGLIALVNTQPVESPVPNHIAFLLDIDVACADADIPRRDDEMWTLVERMRATKNQVFEALITDEARGLFQK